MEDYKNDLFVSEPSSVRAELLNTKGNLTEGTCQWIRRNETYQSWLEAQDSGLLWISGGPGRGKTMLSIFLTQEWESLPDCVFYVFCGEKSTSDEVTILRSLLYQVLKQAPSMVEHVEGCLGTGERTKRALSSRGDLWAMFANIIKDPRLGPVLGLIDGLDECNRDSTRWLLNNLRRVFDKESTSRLLPSNPFRISIVSRDMPGLRSYPRLNLETKRGVIGEDVARVIDAKMKEHELFSELDHDFIKEVKKTLRDRSDGTFLWVGFAIQELLSVETKTEMRLALDAIPQDLGALYSKILLRIKGPMKEKIAQLLPWVTLACHSLTPSQLAEALDVDSQAILDLVAMSGSLLVLSEQPVWNMSQWEIDYLGLPQQLCDSRVVVKLVHSSVSDFLKGEANNNMLRTPEFRIHVEEMELQITQRCLRELEALFFRSLVRKDIPVNTFPSYATFFWPQHARRCGERLERILNSDTAFFQNKSGRLIRSRWWNIYNESFYGTYTYAQSSGLSLLHVCSALGLLPLARRLLQDTALTGNQVDGHDSGGWTALCYALHCEHTAVAQLLVDYGASLTRDFEEETWGGKKESFKPIHKAMELGAEAAEPFLKKTLEGISFSRLARWQWFRSAALVPSLFRKAAQLGDERLIHILCANGATLDSNIAQMALDDTLKGDRSVAVIDLMLQHGANTGNLNLGWVLWGDPGTVYSLVKTLLNYGMDPNRKNGGDPLLHYAVGCGPDIVELLLDRHAQINALNDAGRSALFFALIDHDIETANMLLNRGADLTIKDKHGDTALHLAVQSGNAKAIKLLLDYGANINALDGNGRTAIFLALTHKSFDNMAMLLKRGADITIKDSYGATIFHWAVDHGMFKAAELLLQHDADVDARAGGLCPRTPLRAAILNRNVDMVRLLLEHGADPNWEFPRSKIPPDLQWVDFETEWLKWTGTPLDWNKAFCDEQWAQIAKLLIQRGGVYSRERGTHYPDSNMFT